jgi:AraC family transcriptional regulator
VNITTWGQPARVISAPSIRGFYEQPIVETHAFLFRTRRLELPSHPGSFSIKMVLDGEEDYLLGNRSIRIRPGDLLFLNAGQHYGSRIRKPTCSMSLFFPDACVRDVRRALCSDTADLLEMPGAADQHLPALPQFRFSVSPGTWASALRVANYLVAQSAEAADEGAISLLQSAWTELDGIAPPSALCDVRKKSIRDELLGRIVRAREYIDHTHGIDCRLDTLANIACLSRFHFLRVFREVIGESPVSYARRARLNVAAQDIAGGQSHDAAARRAGYANRHTLVRALRTGRKRNWPN